MAEPPPRVVDPVIDPVIDPVVDPAIGIVTLTDCRLFSAFLHEATPFKLRKTAIDNLPRFLNESG